MQVVAPGTRLGYGKNVNFGARHGSHKHFLFVNDDCFLEGNAVALMLREMKSGVGMVSHLLTYPDGRIFHAGVHRVPGASDWGHLDHGGTHLTFRDVTEVENCCGTSVLVRRKAFYKIGGFDEDYFLYRKTTILR